MFLGGNVNMREAHIYNKKHLIFFTHSRGVSSFNWRGSNPPPLGARCVKKYHCQRGSKILDILLYVFGLYS